MNDPLLQVHRQLACLGPISRFRLAVELLAGERCVTELAAAVELSQSCTTRHLQSMQRAGLVRGVRAGKRVLFRLEPRTTGLLDLIAGAISSSPAWIAAPEPVSPQLARKPGSAAARSRRAPARLAPQAGRRVAPESVTPPAPVVLAVPARYRELEDFLL